MNEKEEKTKLLRSLISKVVANKKAEGEVEAEDKDIVDKTPKTKGKVKDENNEEIKVAPHPLLGNTGKRKPSKKTPNFEKILPGLQEKSTRTGNAISNIQNKLMQKRSTRRGR